LNETGLVLQSFERPNIPPSMTSPPLKRQKEDPEGSSIMANTYYQPKAGTKGLAVVLVEDTYEDLEFHYPRLRLIEEGYDVQVWNDSVYIES